MNKWKQTKKESNVLTKIVDKIKNNSADVGMLTEISNAYEMLYIITIIMLVITMVYMIFAMIKNV